VIVRDLVKWDYGEYAYTVAAKTLFNNAEFNNKKPPAHKCRGLHF
jgi:hypothetical protein